MRTILTAGLVMAITTSASAGVITCKATESKSTFVFGDTWAVFDPHTGNGKTRDFVCPSLPALDGIDYPAACYNFSPRDRFGRARETAVDMIRLIDGLQVVWTFSDSIGHQALITVVDVACTVAE